MRYPTRRIAAAILPVLAVTSLHAATVSRQNADAFMEKVTLIRDRAEDGDRRGDRRTPVTQDEVNSWIVFHAAPLLPGGVTQPQVAMVGPGTLTGQAVVDLDVVAKRRATGGMLDPWSLIGGRVPVAVTGILHTRDGMARFEVQSAEIAGVPVPATFVQELVSYYSRTPERPQGVRLDDPFTLPASIRQIELGQGQAVVVQ